ncbi:MAG: ABC transporter substrate-binding protein [Chthoniobacteraceae bacterium]
MRIACLSAESADICARVGAWGDVVAVTAFADQSGLDPKPVVSGFSSGDAARILSHSPDLVLTFSDVQAELTASLIRAGAFVLATNQRSLRETASAIRLVARAAGRGEAGEELAESFERELAALRRSPARRPRVYFEEWPDPPISGIGWVGELIELTGGEDIFAGRRARSAKERTVRDEEVLADAPDFILASWCGKPVDLASLRRRFSETPAGRADRIMELPSADFLQPGPRLIEGARILHRLLSSFA